MLHYLWEVGVQGNNSFSRENWSYIREINLPRLGGLDNLKQLFTSAILPKVREKKAICLE